MGQTVTRDLYADGIEELCAHSRRCAAAAQELAERSKIVAPEDAYTLGLLHDIGEFLLRSLLPEEMENILWLADSARTEREVSAFGVDHGQVGQWILESCGLPRQLAAAVQAHHDARRTSDPVTSLLHVADVIARAKDVSELATHDALGASHLSALRLTRGDVAAIHSQLDTESEDSRQSSAFTDPCYKLDLATSV